MNWYQNPSAIEQLAAAYVAGTLQGRARDRFEAVMQRQPALVAAVNDWTDRLAPLHRALPTQAPNAELWGRIVKATVKASDTAPVTVAPSWWRRLLSPAPAGALAVGLLVGALVPAVWQAHVAYQSDMELPDSYVGVLATAQGQPGLIISSLRRGKVVDIKQVTPVAVPLGQTLYLWRIDKAGAVAGLGPMPDGKWTHLALRETAEQVFFPAVELAVSLEPLGTQPDAPTQPFVYRGLCGKLWR
jgi:anti-sigma-K factor RskA